MDNKSENSSFSSNNLSEKEDMKQEYLNLSKFKSKEGNDFSYT
jgi:hypothetical protein